MCSSRNPCPRAAVPALGNKHMWFFMECSEGSEGEIHDQLGIPWSEGTWGVHQHFRAAHRTARTGGTRSGPTLTTAALLTSPPFPIYSSLDAHDLRGIDTHKTGLYANSQNAIPGKTISTRPQRGATPLFCVYTFTLSCFGYFWQLFQGKISIPSHLGSSCLSSPLVM